MAGHGVRKVRECLRKRGSDFRRKPRSVVGLPTCRHCGYQVALHESILAAADAAALDAKGGA